MEIAASRFISLGMYICSLFLIAIVFLKGVKYGVLYFLPLIPLRFLFEKMKELPLGGDLVDVMVLVLIIGWLFNNKGFEKSGSVKLLILYSFIMLFSLINGYIYLDFGFLGLDDSRLQFWKDYMMMIVIFMIVLNNIDTMDDIKKLVFHISIIFLLVCYKFFSDFSDASFDHFSEQTRVASVFGFLGANHLAAFIVEYMAIFLTIHYFFKNSRKLKLYYLSVSLLSFYPLLYLYSRAAYIAMLAVLLLLGLIKDRRILVAAFCVLILWQVILPRAVVERIEMTTNSSGEIAETASSGRLTMWGLAFDTFESHPIFGIGFRSFENMEFADAPTAYKATGRQHTLKNVHNIYLQTLAEMGLVGIIMLFCIFAAAFRSGWRLYKASSENFLKGLGLGFSLCVIASFITNIFGDRWYILLIQIYFWMFWALVERGLIITKAESSLKEYSTG